MEYPRTKSEAVAQGLKYYCTGKPCKHGHYSVRYVQSNSCYECCKIRATKWARDNPGKYKSRLKKWREENKEYVREWQKLWREENKDYLQLYQKKWYEENREDTLRKVKDWAEDNKEWVREYSKNHYENNKYMYISYSRERKAAKIQATVEWCDKGKMRRKYQIAEFLSYITDEEYHVDHIVPLQGVNVCGLHCEDNLRVVEAWKNRRKGNKFDPDEKNYFLLKLLES